MFRHVGKSKIYYFLPFHLFNGINFSVKTQALPHTPVTLEN